MSAQHSFRKTLIKAMADQKMTVRVAAQCAGVPKSTIQNWRSGHNPVNFEAVQRLAAALGLSFSFMLTGKKELVDI